MPTFAVVVVAIVLAWQMICAALATRAPSDLAARLSPGSALVLGRAADDALAAGRRDDAAHLAALSLAKAPFSVRALRILAQVQSDAGNKDAAEEMFTLAGNWSLRDDVSHGWLVLRRLEQGDYAGAFNHADTVTRRRADIRPQTFNLFTTAVAQDRRALPALTTLVAARPPWRDAYISSLFETEPGNVVLASLAISLQGTEGPLSDTELEHLYARWLRLGRIPGLLAIRTAVQRPSTDVLLQDPDFSGEGGPPPFVWSLKAGAGFTAIVLPDELTADGTALQVDYDGYSSAVLAEQLVLLRPGRYRLSGRERVTVGPEDSRLAWTVTCLDSPRDLASRPSGKPDGGTRWRSFGLDFVIPELGCGAQWIRLSALPGDRPAHVTLWYRGLDIQSVQ